MKDDELGKEQDLSKTLEYVRDIGAGLGGIATGVLATIASGGNPLAGASVGVVASETIKRIFTELWERHDQLSRWQQVRSVRALTIAAEQIAKRTSEGEILRDDGFFGDGQSRSQADEVVEGLLIRCRDAYQEKKIPFIANIFVVAAFDSSYSADQISFALVLSERLTFRQLCLLKLIEQNRGLKRDNYVNEQQGIHGELLSVLQEIQGLYEEGLVGVRHAPDGENWGVVLGLEDIAPDLLRLRPAGKRLSNLMLLKDISDSDIDETVGDLLNQP